jgi:hypothetical protein
MENCGIGEDGDIGMVGEREPNAAADGSLKKNVLIVFPLEAAPTRN